MPRFDGTGPNGMGPRTGRGLGQCDFGAARGFGRMRRFGMGCPFVRNTVTKEEQLAGLNDYKKILNEEVEFINQQIQDLEKND
jgi:hypothetical protein